ncbi:MAG: sigma-54 dependent transcriptional regulator [Planctomycetia bacterium]|nr:sigma-54 dependent transcriptional regulator [Planctomycetia bacterium]
MMNKKLCILIVDDDRQVLYSTADWLQTYGHQVFTAENVQEAILKGKEREFNLVFTDLCLGMESGLDVLNYFQEENPNTAVAIISGYGTIDAALNAVRHGAYDFLTKPLLDDKVLGIIEKVTKEGGSSSDYGGQKNEKAAVITSDGEEAGTDDEDFIKYRVDEGHLMCPRNEVLGTKFSEIPSVNFEGIIGNDPKMLHVYEMIENIADTRATVLITGESGTGKSMIARAIHRRSMRSQRPFVEVACGALPETLLESELFGHVAGAFTDAKTEKIGRFRQADGGTLFLDEIATASVAMQIKLLRVLQDFEFEPVGSSKTYHVDTRVILATNENLAEAVEKGRFRQDLYYRINVINIELPALRHRVGDIPLLARAFLKSALRNTKREVLGFTPETMAILQMYSWKGNIRELQNVIERAVLLGRHNYIQPEELPSYVIPPSGIPVISEGYRDSLSRVMPSEMKVHHGLKESLSSPEREIILRALRACHWSCTKTAAYLGINRTTLYKKMKRFNLQKPMKKGKEKDKF